MKFPHSGMSVILRGPRPGEAPLADTGPLHLFAEQEYRPEQKTGEFVSHDELGTDHSSASASTQTWTASVPV